MTGLEKEVMTPLAIPHNSNTSKAVMFGSKADSAGRPHGAAYAERRQHFEPLVG